ncbi:MAG: hypothetical protein QM677_01075 [Microbacterium sp.]
MTLSRFALLGAVLLLALAWMSTRRARRRRRAPGAPTWLMLVFAVALLAFIVGHTFTTGQV